MTNKQVLKLYAKYRPDLLVELLDDIYCCGWNNGAESAHKNIEVKDYCFDEEWLNKEYDKDFFREQDVENLIKSLFNTLVLECPTLISIKDSEKQLKFIFEKENE